MLAGMDLCIGDMLGINLQTKHCRLRGNRPKLVGKPSIKTQGTRLSGLVLDAADGHAGTIDQLKGKQTINGRKQRQVIGKFFAKGRYSNWPVNHAQPPRRIMSKNSALLLVCFILSSMNSIASISSMSNSSLRSTQT